MTAGQHTLVAVRSALYARNRSRANEVRQPKCCLLPTAHLGTCCFVSAGLAALGRIDPLKAYALTVNVQGIPVDDGCTSDNLATQGGRCCRQKPGD